MKDPNQPLGAPYPPYDIPVFVTFADLCETVLAEYGSDLAFEYASGDACTYSQLLDRVARRRNWLDHENAGRFVAIEAADAASFIVDFLAVACSDRCAILCDLDESGVRALKNREAVPPEVTCILASSGTTGTQKAVMLTERALLSDLSAGLRSYEFAHGARFVHLLPSRHAFGLVCDLLAPLATGGTVCLPPTESAFLVGLSRFRPTALNLPPRGAAALARALDAAAAGGVPHDQVIDVCGGALQKILVGGAGMPTGLLAHLREFGIEAFGCYGLSECSPCVAVNRDRWKRDGSCGVVLDCNEVRFSSEGEILVRGTNVMTGYVGRPDLTSRVLDKGWLHTGDRGFLDGDGFLFVEGRLDDGLVLSNGRIVAPECVERVLDSCPVVEESLVFAAQDSRENTVLGARIVARPGATHGEVERAVRSLRFGDDGGLGVEVLVFEKGPLPRTDAGKLRRTR